MNNSKLRAKPWPEWGIGLALAGARERKSVAASIHIAKYSTVRAHAHCRRGYCTVIQCLPSLVCGRRLIGRLHIASRSSMAPIEVQLYCYARGCGWSIRSSVRPGRRTPVANGAEPTAATLTMLGLLGGEKASGTGGQQHSSCSFRRVQPGSPRLREVGKSGRKEVAGVCVNSFPSGPWRARAGAEVSRSGGMPKPRESN